MPQFHQKSHEMRTAWFLLMGIASLLGIMAYVLAPWFRTQSVLPILQSGLMTLVAGLPAFVGIGRSLLGQWPRLISPDTQWSLACQAMTDVVDAVVMIGVLYVAIYWGASR